MGRCKTVGCKTPSLGGHPFCRECRKLQPIIEEPQLLVFHEKHGERYFYVPDDHTLFTAALKVLNERHAEDYWYFKPDKPKAPDFTKEQVEAMPESLQSGAMKRLLEYSNELREWENDSENYNNVVKAVETKDGRLAWQCLRDYSEGEYQRVSLERLESPEPDED
jgi:hypothetical protein